MSSATVYGAWANNPVPLTEDARCARTPSSRTRCTGAGRASRHRLGRRPPRCQRRGTFALLSLSPRTAPGWITRCLMGVAGIRAGDNDPPMQFLHLDDLASAVEHVRRERLSGPFNVAPDGWIPGDTARALVGDGPRLHLPDGAATRLAEWSWRMRLGPMPPGLVPYTQIRGSLRAIASAGWLGTALEQRGGVRCRSCRLAVVDVEPQATAGARARRRRYRRGPFGVATGLIFRKARRTWGLWRRRPVGPAAIRGSRVARRASPWRSARHRPAGMSRGVSRRGRSCAASRRGPTSSRSRRRRSW